MALIQDLSHDKLHLVRMSCAGILKNVHSDIVESTEKKTLDGFATFEPPAARLEGQCQNYIISIY